MPDLKTFSACTDIEWPDYDTYGDNREAYWRAIEAVREAFDKKVAEVGYSTLIAIPLVRVVESIVTGCLSLKVLPTKLSMPTTPHQGHEHSSIEDTLRVVTPVQKIITVWGSVVMANWVKHFTELAKFKA